MRITLKALSPVHIGTGIEYSPLEFVLNTDKGNTDWLWRIDPSRFLSSLSEERRDQFVAAVNNTNFDLKRFAQGMDLRPMRRYIVRDFTGRSSIPAVRECIKTADRAYIPGSSLKGAFRTALLWSVAKDDERFVSAIREEARERINKGTIGKRYEESVFNCSNEKYNPTYDLLKFLAVSDFMPKAVNKIRLDKVRTLSLGRDEGLEEKKFEIFVEAVTGSFEGTIGVSEQIAAAIRHPEYRNLGQKLAILGMDGPDDTDAVIPHLKKVMREFNLWCLKKERRLAEEAHDEGIEKKMKGIENRLGKSDLIRVGFGVGTTYQTLFGLIEEKDPELAAGIASKIGRSQRTVSAEGCLEPPYPKTIEMTAAGYFLGWLEWLNSDDSNLHSA